MSLKQRFQKARAESLHKRKEYKEQTLNNKMSKYILENSSLCSIEDIPKNYHAMAEKGRSANLSLRCFFKGSFKKTAIWNNFLSLVQTHQQALIMFMTREFGETKANYWCLTNIPTEAETGISRIYIPIRNAKSIYVMKFKQFLKEINL